MQKAKKLLVFENKFLYTFLYLNCAGYAIRKSHLAVLAVLVAIRKLQLAVSKKSFEKAASKNVDEIGLLFASNDNK